MRKPEYRYPALDKLQVQRNNLDSAARDQAAAAILREGLARADAARLEQAKRQAIAAHNAFRAVK